MRAMQEPQGCLICYKGLTMGIFVSSAIHWHSLPENALAGLPALCSYPQSRVHDTCTLHVDPFAIRSTPKVGLPQKTSGQSTKASGSMKGRYYNNIDTNTLANASSPSPPMHDGNELNKL